MIYRCEHGLLDYNGHDKTSVNYTTWDSWHNSQTHNSKLYYKESRFYSGAHYFYFNAKFPNGKTKRVYLDEVCRF